MITSKTLKDLLQMDEDSSAFDTDAQLTYIRKQKKRCELGTKRELRLIGGIFTAR